jgi:uncharacterized protein (DUF4415 family)
VAKKERIVRYSAEELADMIRRGESRTDWAKQEALTYEEIEAQIAADPDEAGMVYDWDSTTTEMPKPKADLHMRIDRDILDYFRKTGKGYQTRINTVLRSYVQHMRSREAGED